MTSLRHLVESTLVLLALGLGYIIGYGNALNDAQQTCIAGMTGDPLMVDHRGMVPVPVWCEHIVREEHGEGFPITWWHP